MKKEMTIPALKKELARLERKELEQMLCSLYKNCDQAEQTINLKLLDETYGRKLLEQYQSRMYKIFFPNNIMYSGFSLPVAKKVIFEFKKVNQNKELVTELKLYFVECGTEFTNMYGDIDERFYDSLCSVFHDVAKSVSEDECLFNKWNKRLIQIVNDSGGIGWGLHDYLIEEYYSIPWIEEEIQY